MISYAVTPTSWIERKLEEKTRFAVSDLQIFCKWAGTEDATVNLGILSGIVKENSNQEVSDVLIVLWVLTMAALVSTLLMAFAINPTPVLILLFITSTLTFLQLLATDNAKRLRPLNLILVLIWVGTFVWQAYSFISTLA